MTRVAAMLAVCGAVAWAAASSPPGGAVSGTVVNAKTHEPLRRATVFLVDRGSFGRRWGSLSDAEGRFSFSGVGSGSYRLEAAKDGYVRGSVRNPSALEIAPGQELRNVVYALIPAAVLTGRVVDDLGDPAPGAQVHVLRAVYSSGTPQLTPVAMQVANDRGEFRAAGLSAGTYYVKVSYSDPLERSGAWKTSAEDYGYPTVFYPGTTDLSQAAPVELTNGDEHGGVEVRLVRARTFAVMGSVVNGAGATIALYAKSAGGYAAADVVASTQADQFGRFLFNHVPAGGYGVAASVSPGDGSMLSGRTRVDVSESAAVNAVSLTLHAGSAVKGVIRLDGSTEKADWLSQLAMFLRPLGETPQTGGSPLRAQIEPNGAFEVSDVADDTYAPVFIYLPDDYYVKQVQAASQDVLRSGLAIRNGVSDPLSIVLSSHGGRIEGVVANGKGETVPAAHVVVGVSGTGSFYRHVTADQNGHFSVRGMAPGAYQLIALESVEEGAYSAPAFFARYQRTAKQMTVEENGRYSLMLNVEAQE